MELILNGKTYTTKPLDFEGFVELEQKYGVTIGAIQEFAEKPFALTLGIVCFVTKLSKEEANKEITAHIKGGGKFSDIIEFAKVLTQSDFF